MKNSEEFVWWLEIIKVAIPSLVALIVPFIAGYFISRKIEDYKKNTNMELEKFKANLKRENDEALIFNEIAINEKVSLTKDILVAIDRTYRSLNKLFDTVEKKNNKYSIELHEECVENIKLLEKLRSRSNIFYEPIRVSQLSRIANKARVFIKDYENKVIITIPENNNHKKKTLSTQTQLS